MRTVIIGTVLFWSGTAVALLSPLLMLRALMSAPGLARGQRRPDEVASFAWLAVAAFFVGAGLVLVSPMEPMLVPVGVALVVIGAYVGYRSRPNR